MGWGAEITGSNSSCKDLRNAVAICLQKSPCVLIERNTPKQCVENSELRKELPEECQIQLINFFECKYVASGDWKWNW